MQLRKAAAPLLLVLAAGAALLPAGGAPAASRTKLWATINVCDSPSNPDKIGLRASMPGSGRAGVMYMRFRIQYFSRREQRWHNIDEKADSGFVRVGSSRYRRRETGWSFTLLPPPGGSSYVLRGRVDYEWRSRDRVVKRAKRYTRKGFRSAAGADPPGFSAAICEIR